MLVQPAVNKRGRAESSAVREASEKRATRAPLLVSGIGRAHHKTVSVEMFKRLDVDPAYQRAKTHMIAKIVRAIQAGGMIPDPVTLCIRPWDKHDPEKLWIVDGFQRVCAFQQLKIPFAANVHESESIDAEKLLFQAMNMKVAVNANVIVKSWVGESAKLLLAANSNPNHPLHSRIHFEQGNSRHKVTAAVCAAACLGATTGVFGEGKIQSILARLDTGLGTSHGKKAADTMLRLIAHSFVKSPPPRMVATVVGCLAFEYWDGGRTAVLPSTKVMKKIGERNWMNEVPAFSNKYRSVIETVLRRAWKP